MDMKTGFLICAAFAIGLGAAAVDEARPAYGAMLRIPSAGAAFAPRAYVVREGQWRAKEAADGLDADSAGNRAFRIPLHAGAAGDYDGTCAFRDSPDGVRAEWSLRPQKNAKAAALELRGTLPLEDYAGGAIVADGARTAIPVETARTRCFDRSARAFTLFDVHGRERLSLLFPKPHRLGIEMDGDPKIGGKLIFCIPIAERAEAEKDAAISLAFAAPGGLKVGPDGNYVISGGKDWIPFAPAKTVLPGSPLDFSAMRPTVAPAGKWGRIIAKGDDFVFEKRPDVPVRFYGVNLCTDAIVPETRADADALAERLARMGYNAVRIHHQEYTLLGKSGSSVTLDPERAARFDALVAACVRNGLYLTTDLFCSRSWRIPWRDVGIDRDGLVGMGDFKALVQVHEGVYSNYLAFARTFLTHRNVYTGRPLAEEPALGWISLVNEGCLGSDVAALEKWESWRAAWKAWLAEKRRADAAVWADVPDAFPDRVMSATKHAVAFKLFLGDMEMRFAERTKRFLRDELGCRALLCNMNGVFHPVHVRKARVKPYDYVDGHFYVDHPNFLGQNWKPPSTAGTGNPVHNAMGANYPAFAREWGKPFTITEWNYCAPNPNRVCQGLLVGAAAAFQGWGGMWHFDFAGQSRQCTSPETAKLGAFVMAGDPVMRAADMAAVCLYLRGDMAEAKRKYADVVPAEVFEKPAAVGSSEDTWHYLNWLTWYGKVGQSTAAAELPPGVEEVSRYPDSYFRKDLDALRRRTVGVGADAPLPAACGGAARIDGRKGTFVVETPRTCGGFVPGGAFTAGPLEARTGETPTALWASSLDGRAIGESRNLLLVHLVDTVATDISFTDESRRILFDWGRAPQLVRRASVEVSLALPHGRWRVEALAEDGSVRYDVPARYENGRLRFTASTAGEDGKATFHYSLTAESVAPAAFKAGERIGFLGDSISEGGSMAFYLEYLSAIRHSGKGVRCANMGRSGDTSWGGAARWEREVAVQPVDRVFAMFGMNDVNDPSCAERYAKSMREIVGKVQADGKSLVLLTPSPYDAWGRQPTPIARSAEKLAACAEEVRRIADGAGAPLVDLHAPMRKVFQNNPDRWFNGDRVHPDFAGHMLMASLIWTATGEPGEFSRIAFDAKGAKSFTAAYSPKGLPCAVDADYRNLAAVYPLALRMNTETIVVANLAPGTYALRANGAEIGRFTSAQLALGVNVAELETPNQHLSRRALDVARRLARFEQERRVFGQVQAWLLAAKVDVSDSAAVADWIRAERPKSKNYSWGAWRNHMLGVFERLYPERDALAAKADALHAELAAVRPVAWTLSLD